jgi:hypothetical protein
VHRLLASSIAICATGLLVLAVAAQPAVSKPLKQTSCGKVKKKAKKKQCKLNLKIYNELKGLQLSGTRTEESGVFTVEVPFSAAYCNKKKVVVNGKAHNDGWAVDKARKTSDGIQALVRISGGTQGGFDVTYFEGVRLNGDQWESGEVFGDKRELRNFVPAEATPARC